MGAGALAVVHGWNASLDCGLELAGRPLLAHALDACRAARSVDVVRVAVRDPAAAELASRLGAAAVTVDANSSGDRLVDLLHVLDGFDPVPRTLVSVGLEWPLLAGAAIDELCEALAGDAFDSAFLGRALAQPIYRRGEDSIVCAVDKTGDTLWADTRSAYALQTAGVRSAGRLPFGRTVVRAIPAEADRRLRYAGDLGEVATALRDRARGGRVAALPQRIDAIVFDFDGVFTDNKVFVFQDGREAVRCDRGDGWGLAQLRTTGIPLAVLSTEKNPVVQARCEKLGLECLQGIDDKVRALDEWLGERDLAWGRLVYVGNDTNDMGCIERAGCGVAVADAVDSIRSAADVVLETRGGLGAVRELTELVLSREAGS
jgi:YrbI family 3-deoxy-D-manno-octulosonate 8-phosphate phosphatase